MRNRYLLLVAAVGVQVLLLGVVAGSGAAIRAWGTPVTLRVAPYDPYDIMRGYYARLQYDINRPAEEDLAVREYRVRRVYAELAPGAEGVWEVVAMHREWPDDVAPAHVVLRGKDHGGRIEYGIEQYFVPEAERTDLDDMLRQQGHGTATVRVGPFGIAQVESLEVGGRTFRY